MPNPLSPPTRRGPVLAAVVLALVLVAGCGVKVDDGGLAGGGPVTQGGGTTPTKRLTDAELEKLFPLRADLPTGYTRPERGSTSDDDTGEFDDQCPQMAEATKDLGTRSRKELERAWTNPKNARIEVTLNGRAKVRDDAIIDRYIEAANSCGEMDFSSGGPGSTITLQASREDRWGEQGFRMKIEVTLNDERLPRPVTVRGESISFRRGSVSVTVSVQGGVDEETFETDDPDTATLEKVADGIDAQLKQKLGS